jgi:glycosyltransferase involved in cell wall biosynthesis
MYLIAIHVPIYLAGERRLVTTEWKRALLLLRDSFGGRFGPLVVMAPFLDAAKSQAAQVLEEVDESNDGIRLLPVFPQGCRARWFWMRERQRWILALRQVVTEAQVVHAGMDDVYQPIAFLGHRVGVQAGKPTVFVRDIDTVQQVRQMCAGQGWRRRLRGAAYAWTFDRCMRYGVGTAALSLLKGKALMRRYARYARNPREFQDTSHTSRDIVPFQVVETRLQTLQQPRPLRLVYCGRLEDRKGVAESVEILRLLRSMGTRFGLDIIGDGPERSDIERRIREGGLSDQVRMVGKRPYGPELIRELAGYDALMFTPTSEDTPRMVFDAYAAGLPLIAYDIEYIQERGEAEGAVYPLKRGQKDAAAHELAALGRNRSPLDHLARKAWAAASLNTAEEWYRRRAEWTIEAVDRFTRAGHPRTTMHF